MKKAKNIKKQFSISEPLFRSSLYVFIGQPLCEVRKQLKEKWPDFTLSNELDSKLGLSFVHDAEYPYHFIWLRSYDRSISSQGTLAHELLHFAMEMMRQKNVGLSEESCNETICYLYEYYLTQCLERLV